MKHIRAVTVLSIGAFFIALMAFASPDVAFAAVPAAPSTSNLDPADDHGLYDYDDITNESESLTFTGTSEAGVTSVELYEGAVLLGTDSAPEVEDGGWGVEISLTHGYHELHAIAYNVDGASVPSANYSIIVDTILPTLINARVSGAQEITLEYSEDVYGLFSDYENLILGGTGHAIESIVSGNTSDTHVLQFATPLAAEDIGTGTISVNVPPPMSIKDRAGNDLPWTNDFPVIDGRMPPTDVYVSLFYGGNTQVGDHIYNYDAFNTIAAGVAAVAAGGTVHVAQGEYGVTETIVVDTNGITITGPDGLAFEDQPLVSYPSDCGNIFAIESDGVTLTGINVYRDTTHCGTDYFSEEDLLNVNVYIAGNSTTITDMRNGGGYGVYSEPDTTGQIVTGNQFYGNMIGALLGSGAGGVSLENNTFSSLIGVFAICGYDFETDNFLPCGDLFNDITITNNEFTEGYFGMWLFGFDQSGTATVGPGNNIHDQYGPGIVVLGMDGLKIEGNVITRNCEGCDDGASGYLGLDYDGADTGDTVDARNNWWGSETGPSIWSNPSGTGDGIDDGTFDPAAARMVTIMTARNASGNVREEQRVAFRAFLTGMAELRARPEMRMMALAAPEEDAPPTVLYNPWCLDSECERTNEVRRHSSTGSIMAGSAIARSLGLGGVPSPAPTPTPSGTIIGAPSIPDYICRPSLMRGMIGPAVVGLQNVLKAVGIFPRDIDSTGFFGNLTESAVKTFQASKGITPIGIVGPLTCGAINAL